MNKKNLLHDVFGLPLALFHSTRDFCNLTVNLSYVNFDSRSSRIVNPSRQQTRNNSSEENTVILFYNAPQPLSIPKNEIHLAPSSSIAKCFLPFFLCNLNT